MGAKNSKTYNVTQDPGNLRQKGEPSASARSSRKSGPVVTITEETKLEKNENPSPSSGNKKDTVFIPLKPAGSIQEEDEVEEIEEERKTPVEFKKVGSSATHEEKREDSTSEGKKEESRVNEQLLEDIAPVKTNDETENKEAEKQSGNTAVESAENLKAELPGNTEKVPEVTEDPVDKVDDKAENKEILENKDDLPNDKKEEVLKDESNLVEPVKSVTPTEEEIVSTSTTTSEKEEEKQDITPNSNVLDSEVKTEESAENKTNDEVKEKTDTKIDETESEEKGEHKTVDEKESETISKPEETEPSSETEKSLNFNVEVNYEVTAETPVLEQKDNLTDKVEVIENEESVTANSNEKEKEDQSETDQVTDNVEKKPEDEIKKEVAEGSNKAPDEITQYKEAIEKIRVRTEELESQVNNFSGTKDSVTYFQLEEELLGSIEKLDRMDINDKSDLKDSRKEIIKRIYQVLEVLDQKSTKQT